MQKLIIFASTLLALVTASCRKSLPEEFENKMRIIGTAQLGTVEYTITKVVKANDEPNRSALDPFTWKVGDRKMLFTTKATMKAGVNLTPENYSVDIDETNKSITLTLPEPEIISLNMKPEDSKLVYEQVSVTRFDFNNAERQELLKQGEESIRNSHTKDILNDAKANATQFFRSVLTQAGFKEIHIKFANK